MNLVVRGNSMDPIVMHCLGCISGRADFRVSVRLSCVDVSLGLSVFWCFSEEPGGPEGVGGTLIFLHTSLGPSINLSPPKNIRSFKHPKNIFEILATPNLYCSYVDSYYQYNCQI